MKIVLVLLLVACKREASPPSPSPSPSPAPAPEVVPTPVADATAPIDTVVDATPPIDTVVADVKPGGVKGQILYRDTTPAGSPARPHSGCTITALEKTTKKVFVGKTDKRGDYRIELPPGTYAVNFSDCGVVDCSSTRDPILTAVIENGNWPTLSVTTQSCNKCMDALTQIATPEGSVAISRLRAGDRILVERDGERVVATVAAVQRVPGRAARRVTLSDGRIVRGAPLHPFADGRGIGAVGLGDRVAGATVTAIEDVPYSDGYAYDILPSIDGAYVADGVPLRSTMR